MNINELYTNYTQDPLRWGDEFGLEFLDYIRALVYPKCHNKDQIEDIVSTIVVNLFNSFDKFDPAKSSFKTWLTLAAQADIKNYFRDINKRSESYLQER